MTATPTTASTTADPVGAHGQVTVPTTPATLSELPSTWTLPHTARSVSTARRLAQAAVAGWGMNDDAADSVLLVVSELVTNAVEHALPPLTLHLGRPDEDGTMTIAVTDGGPATETGAWISTCTPDEHGRGTSIIDYIATNHGTTTNTNTTTHWATLPTT
ncbi:ATP-binding protein [Streptomyces sp. NPDC016734]